MDIDPKADVEHIDAPIRDGEKVTTATGAAVVESAYANLSRWQIVKTFWLAIIFAAVATFGSLTDGYEFAVTAGILANQGFINKFGLTNAAGEKFLGATMISLWGGLLSVTTFLGQIIAGWSNDVIGRKGNMYIFTAFFIIGVTLECVSKDWKMWLAAKTLFGCGLGMVQVTMTTYISEIAPTQVRGALLALYSLGFALGQFASSIALQVIQTTDPLNWLRAVYTQWIFIGLWIIGMVFLPESPWHLARQKKVEQAKKSMKRIYGHVAGYDVEREFLVLATEIEHAEFIREEMQGHKIVEIFRGVNLRRTLASTFPIVLQQLCGVPIFFSYLTYFFQMAGLKDPFVASVIMYVLLLAGIIISFWTTERVGRRPLLLYGCVIMFIANIGLGLSGSFTITSSALNASLAMSCIWVFTYAMSAAPIGFVVAAETATPRLKSLTTGFAIGCYGALNVVFQFTVPLMLAADGANWGVKAAYLFAGLTVFGALGIFFFTPETSGRTFSEMDELFELRISPRHFAKTQTTAQKAGIL
ncbi:hypothetical protein JCM24511_01101 [Saitozyma sp. JCM 24511]|nr:hypothetical protein JCM24511_01101 [Saitozyma sp. JCM 24511]